MCLIVLIDSYSYQKDLLLINASYKNGPTGPRWLSAGASGCLFSMKEGKRDAKSGCSSELMTRDDECLGKRSIREPLKHV